MVSTGRTYSSRRSLIVGAIVNLLKTIDGTGDMVSNISNNVFPTLRFYDQMKEFPCLMVVAGPESRDYQTGGYRDRYLNVRIVMFLNQEEALSALDALLEDVESLIEDNGQLTYTDRRGNEQKTQDITVLSISTDEGILDPIAVGEMVLRVQY